MEEAHALVERQLTRRSENGFASGGLDAAFILRELDDAVADMAGERLPTAQSMSPEDWIAYRLLAWLSLSLAIATWSGLFKRGGRD